MGKVKRDRTGTPTERALVRMLMENTGRHFLDSGGAYGRSWQRNQATGMWQAKDWLATPEIWSDGGFGEKEESPGVFTSTDAWPTLSTFHFLRGRLEFNSQLTAWLIREGNRSDDAWLVSMEEWAEERHEGDRNDYWGPGMGDYTYNRENLLSQDFQYSAFTYQDQPYVALQIHGGADARGGFTAPKVFAVTTDEAYSFMDWHTWSFGHEHAVTDTQEPLPGLPALPEPEQHFWDAEGPHDWIEYGGTFVTMDAYAEHGHVDGKHLVWERSEATGDVWRPRCPIDGAVCEIYAKQAW